MIGSVMRVSVFNIAKNHMFNVMENFMVTRITGPYGPFILAPAEGWG